MDPEGAGEEIRRRTRVRPGACGHQGTSVPVHGQTLPDPFKRHLDVAYKSVQESSYRHEDVETLTAKGQKKIEPRGARGGKAEHTQ